jgi:SAM-dependent methyltransferase
MEEKKLYNEKPIISKWIADIYDRCETDTNEIEFALSVIGPEPKRILEIACGSGRILVPFAKAGYNVTGLDFDEYMLNKIESKCNGMDNITWRKADVINDDWGSGFDVVILAGNILFNIVTDMNYKKAQELLIQKASNSLVPGGKIYIDYGYTLYPEKWFNNPNEDVIWEGADSDGNIGKMLLLGGTFDSESGIYKFIRRFKLKSANGEIIKQDIPSIKHFATLEQIHNWLDSAGFVIEQEYGDYNRNPISEKTNRAIILARKVL